MFTFVIGRVFPGFPSSQNAEKIPDLEAVSRSFQPFSITFSKFEYFAQKNAPCTMYPKLCVAHMRLL